MRFDRLTIKGQEALRSAQELAERLGHPQLEPEHLLDTLIRQEDGVVPTLLKKIGESPELLEGELKRHFAAQPKVQGGQLTVSNRLEALLRQAQEEADQFKDEYVSTEHLLLALVGRRRVCRPAPARPRSGPRRDPEGAGLDPREPARHRPEPRGQVPGAQTLRARPDGPRAPGKARPGHRPRRRRSGA